MSRPSAAVRTTLGLVGCALALSACGTGQGAQTYKQRTTADSTNAKVSTVDIRGLQVLAPTSGDVLLKGADAMVTGRFVNNADALDTLVSASSPAATSVVLTQDGKTVTSVPLPSLTITPGSYGLTLTGLVADLRPGSYVPIELDFAKAGRTTVQVPVLGPAYSGDTPRPTTTNFTQEG